MKMNNTVILLLLGVVISTSVSEGKKSVIRQVPSGPIDEADNTNVTLVCDTDTGDQVSSVVWYYNGHHLRHIPDPDCATVELDMESGSGSGDHEELISHEVGSGDTKAFDSELESNLPDYTAEEYYSDVNNDITSPQLEKLYDYDELEVSYSGSGDISETESGDNSGDYEGSGDMLLCDVDPTKLVLHNETRQFSGDYSCAVIQGGYMLEQSDTINIDVGCKCIINYCRIM